MSEQAQHGIGVDAHGGAVVDPTQNVKDLNDASHKRQDDLREMFGRYVQSELKRVEDIANLKADHVKELTTVHQVHDYALHKAEAGRLDALRQNDREDVKVLAAQTTAKAEALQTQVSTTADTLAKTFAANLAEQNKRLSANERQQAEGLGKATVESPMMAELVAETKALRLAMAGTSGQGTGAKNLWFIIAAVITVLGFLLIGGGVLVSVVLYISNAR